MKPLRFGLIFSFWLVFGPRARAATLYVDVNSTGPAAPYTNWATASTDIQDAINAANPGDLILVNNGVYQTGGLVVPPYGITNRVVATIPVTIESVNGPSVTSIIGNPVLGSSAVRGAWLTNGAALVGFTVAFGGTWIGGSYPTYQDYGGGVWAYSTNSTVSNCIIVSNQASGYGGGVNSGTLYNCAILGNSSGGAVYGALLFNCTVCQNSTGASSSPGGALNSSLFNCILCSNYDGIAQSNYTLNSDRLYYCCTSPNVTNFPGNICADPQFVDGYHLSANSPCRRTGSGAYTNGTDIDGQPWLNPPSMGCDEYYPGGPLTVGIDATATNVATNFNDYLASGAVGSQSSNLWSFGDGTFATNQPSAWHSWSVPGQYSVSLTAYNDDNSSGVTASLVVNVGVQPTHYVSLTSTNPVPPYTSWDTAATNIQSAISAASSGDVIIVNDGAYQMGQVKISSSDVYTRVAVTIPVTVQSLDGPSFASITGQPTPAYVRCAWLTNGASLVGFTLASGGAFLSSGMPGGAGGGVYCFSSACIVSNCVIASNAAYTGGGVFGGLVLQCALSENIGYEFGGGAYNSVLDNCILAANSSSTAPGSTGGGGAYSCVLNNSLVVSNYAGITGGGTYNCTLNNCTIAYNMSANAAGGVEGGTASNCVIIGNISSNFAPYTSAGGGGAFNATLYNCTLSSNIAAYGGGALGCTLYNCVLANNNTSNFAYDSGGGASGCTLNNCTLSNNSATYYGGGAYNCILTNCTLTANSVLSYGSIGGGAYECVLNNSLVLSNSSNPNGSAGGTYNCILTNCTISFNSPVGIVLGTASNCIISRNNGGGAGRATLYNCTVISNVGTGVAGCLVFNSLITDNTASGGGGYAEGGGAYQGTLISCVISSNYSYQYGGGAAYATLFNCLVISNVAAWTGGGCVDGTIVNCTIVSNAALGQFGGIACYGGIANDNTTSPVIIENSIVCFNSNYSLYPYQVFAQYGTISSSDVPSFSAPSAIGVITNDPQFVDFSNGNFQLQSNSPCINAGNNAFVSNGLPDLAGNPRISGGTVDMGAYEFQNPASIISYAWLEQYVLATDGSADFADSDTTGMDNWQKWVAGLSPSNSASVLQMLSPASSGTNFVVTWQSVTNIAYFLQRSSSLAPGSFQTIVSNIPGQAGTTFYTDTNAPAPGPWYYRVGVP